ncbi:MAG: FecR family protein [Candidatus Neomarinimicrobiota bacterium]
MNKVPIQRLLHLSCILLYSLEFLLAADGVAVTTKVKGAAERRPAAREEFAPLSPATVLFDRDFVRTGASGFLVMVYLDDKSLLKMKGNTDLEIRGQREGDGISKKIDLMAGILKAEVSEQRKGDFVVSTPTSVASVKGTSFWMASDPTSGDQVMCLDGLVELLNLISGNVVTVGPNETGTSGQDGSLGVNATNPDDLPEDEDETGDGLKELRIRLRNADGEERDLIINYD